MNGITVQKHKKITKERIDKFLSKTYFTDVNLFGKIYGANYPFTSLKTFSVEGKKVISFEEMKKKKFTKDAKVGDSFGPSWTTHWFALEVLIPELFVGQEVHLMWNCNAEALLYSEKGDLLQGLTGTEKHFKRHSYILTKKATGGETMKFYLELSCNELFGCGHNGLINPPNNNMMFKLDCAEIRVFDREAYELFIDVLIIFDMSKELEKTNALRSSQALTCCNHIINMFNHSDRSTWTTCKEISSTFLSQPPAPHTHRIYACGHSHLDIAWLWPYEETKRKAARTFASQLNLFTHHPSHRFVQSQTVLFEWTKTLYPSLWASLCRSTQKGSFIPIGGSYCEFDGNLPSGESMIRQFLYGQNFLLSHFGSISKVFWLPDTFGYSAQLPQIMSLSGITYFLTQKLSWNLINKFPHSSFYWEGLGANSKVLAHFPPADTYCSELKVSEVLYTMNNFKDQDRSNISMLLFGHGDGAGGPKHLHCDILKRLIGKSQNQNQVCEKGESEGETCVKGILGLPIVEVRSPLEFFQDLEEEHTKKKESGEGGLLKWTGELYFELHRGTYTSQAATKAGNRKCELLLREMEVYNSLLLHGRVEKEKEGRGKQKKNLFLDRMYRKDEVDEAWKAVLLNQFHDVLPGSSIEVVYKDALAYYQRAKDIGESIIHDLLSTFHGKGEDEDEFMMWNTWGWDIPAGEIVELELPVQLEQKKVTQNKNLQQSYRKSHVLLHLTQPIPAFGFLTLQTSFDGPDEKKKKKGIPRVKLTESKTSVLMENEILIVEISKSTAQVQVFDKRKKNVEFEHEDEGRPGATQTIFDGNKIVLFDDVPLFWEAWDQAIYSLEKFKVVTDVTSFEVIETGPLRAAVKVTIDLTTPEPKKKDVPRGKATATANTKKKKSSLTQVISLCGNDAKLDFSCSCEWYQSRQFLKCIFPTKIISDSARYEIQFGHVKRPTRKNSSLDVAKFEVSCQKWFGMYEDGAGVTIYNESKYGCSILNDRDLCISLLRSPKAPDANCDMGKHVFGYAVHLSGSDGGFGKFVREDGIVQRSYEYNSKIRVVKGMKEEKYKNGNSMVWMKSGKGGVREKFSGIVLETIKKAEVGGALIFRLYEAFGGKANDVLCVDIRRVFGEEEENKEFRVVETDNLEREKKVLKFEKSEKVVRIPLTFGNFQIRSIKVELVEKK